MRTSSRFINMNDFHNSQVSKSVLMQRQTRFPLPSVFPLSCPQRKPQPTQDCGARATSSSSSTSVPPGGDGPMLVDLDTNGVEPPSGSVPEPLRDAPSSAPEPAVEVPSSVPEPQRLPAMQGCLCSVVMVTQGQGFADWLSSPDPGRVKGFEIEFPTINPSVNIFF